MKSNIGKDISERANTSKIMSTNINDTIKDPIIINKGGPIITNKIIVTINFKKLLFLTTTPPLQAK